MPAKLTSATLLALLALLTLRSPAAHADPLRVAKPAAIGFGFSMLDVGISAGIFAKHGIEVQSVVLAGSAKQQQALIANASDAPIAGHPDELRRFLAGWFDTVAWSKAHKDEMLKYSMEATKLPLDISSKAYDAEMPMFPTDGHFKPDEVAAVENALIETGQLDHLPDNSKIMTEAFLK